LCLACLGALAIYDTYRNHPGFSSDFGAWYWGARAVLNGDDPYSTFGPGLKYGWSTPFVYPLTVVFLGIPFAWMSEPASAALFVAISTFVMTMAITQRGFHLLPMVITPPFQMSVTLGQLSLLFTAAMFYPILCFLTAVKPHAGLPLVAATRSRRAIIAATVLGAMLFCVSMAVLPRWPVEWIRIIQKDPRYLVPVLRAGGILIPLALLRWRRREAWLLLVTSILPQSLTFYYLLPLFTIPRNFPEALSLATLATLGIYLGAHLMPAGLSGPPFYRWSGNVAVLSVYLPCLTLLLIRENREQPELVPGVSRMVRRLGLVRAMP